MCFTNYFKESWKTMHGENTIIPCTKERTEAYKVTEFAKRLSQKLHGSYFPRKTHGCLCTFSVYKLFGINYFNLTFILRQL